MPGGSPSPVCRAHARRPESDQADLPRSRGADRAGHVRTDPDRAAGSDHPAPEARARRGESHRGGRRGRGPLPPLDGTRLDGLDYLSHFCDSYRCIIHAETTTMTATASPATSTTWKLDPSHTTI